MKKNILSSSITAALSIMVFAGCAPTSPTQQETSISAPKTVQSSGVVLANMNQDIHPGDDFFSYVNGTWFENFEIPADKSRYGAFTKLSDDSQEDVLEIIEATAAGDFPKGSDEQKVGDFYQSFMDIDQRNSLGLSPIEAPLSRIENINNHKDLASYLAYANKYNLGGLFALSQFADFKDPDYYMMLFWQGGLGLPEREFYFKDDEASSRIRNEYVAHIATILALAGDKDATVKAEKIMALETKVANIHMKKEDTRNWAVNYNKVPTSDLKNIMPNFNWQAYLTEADIADVDNIVLLQTDYLKQLDAVITDTPIEMWKTYLRWHVLDQSASYLTQEFADANFNFFGKVMSGVEQQQPMWRRGVNLVNSSVGEIIGKVYVKQHFPPEAKARMEVMVDNLLKAYKTSITELDWMTDETRQQALDKLSKFTVKIGYPDTWRDDGNLSVDSKSLIGNLQNLAEVRYAEMLEKQKGKVRKWEWGMTPQTVNAYYNPTANEIVFPAAILQPPFFDMEAEDAVNYGGIGAVIGHEIGHGFDDSGSTFDGDGALRNWWTDDDRHEFEQRTSQLVNQYNSFEALNGLYVNGQYTLGENIGDLGGISIALKAYQLSLGEKASPVLDGFTGEQRVFIGFGQVWAAKYREEAVRSQISTDSHSPPQFRANGTLRNVPEFYEAFNVTEDHALFLPEEKRVKIW
ncbi:peptidase M13 [Alteromonas sp. 5E99-2]|uniref:M13 family metallopeptidase n=1 Tax=Alteromonas sp. 5E99-2 TaxID=2817683 RepID=UPI001A99F99B|nr:M13-type metalloendopeptidase [Alteromonas sp. 5E99-2]MBO1255772.1 peptidase M13 [Alteromonas sp. 5E99-2]